MLIITASQHVDFVLIVMDLMLGKLKICGHLKQKFRSLIEPCEFEALVPCLQFLLSCFGYDFKFMRHRLPILWSSGKNCRNISKKNKWEIKWWENVNLDESRGQETLRLGSEGCRSEGWVAAARGSQNGHSKPHSYNIHMSRLQFAGASVIKNPQFSA